MKVLHVAYSLSESSAATRLACAQHKFLNYSVFFFLGLPSKISFIKERQILSHIVFLLACINRLADRLLCRFVLRDKNEPFNFGAILSLNAILLRILVPIYKIDVVHLHWGGLGFIPSVNLISDIGCKVVVTLHDYHFLTGGCHVPMECDRFFDCCDCPMVKNYKYIKNFIRRQRLDCNRLATNLNISFIAPSTYTRNYAKIYLNHNNISLIGNTAGFEYCSAYDLYSANKDKFYARVINSSLPLIILIGIKKTVRDNKGYELIVKLLNSDCPTYLNVVAIGCDDFKVKSQYASVSYLNGATTLELIEHYVRADICLVPSKFETFSQVTLESILCNTPVVAFDKSGPFDLIRNGTGFLVKSFDDVEYINAVFANLSYKRFKYDELYAGAAYLRSLYSPSNVSRMHKLVYEQKIG